MNASEPSTDSVDDRPTRWLRRLFYIAVALTASLRLAMNEADPDLWGHIQYGRELLRDGRLPETTTWSFTTVDYPWVNHEILSELALAWVEQRGGGTALALLKFSLGLMVFGLMIWNMERRKIAPWLAAVVLGVVAVNIDFHWHFRPQIFGYAAFAAMIALVGWCFEGWEGAFHFRRPGLPPMPLDQGPKYAWSKLTALWLAVPLFAVWTNTHGGFAAGVCIFAAYLTLRSCEAYLCWGREAVPRIKRLTLFLVVAVLATFLNPYGPGLHLWLLEDVVLPRPEIIDWQPLPLFSSESAHAWLLFALIGLGFGCARKSRDASQAVILTITAWQGIAHVRHLPFLAILCGFWLPPYLDSLWRSVRSTSPSQSASSPPFQRGWLAVPVLLWIIGVSWKLFPLVTTVQVDRQTMPVDALQFLARHELHGNVVVTFNWAQYALYAFAHQSEMTGQVSKVAFDGRLRTCYPQELIDIYFDFLFGATDSPRYRSPMSPPLDPDRALSFADPDLVLLSRQQQPTVRTMQRHADKWTLLYQDRIAQVWGRTKKFGAVESPDYLPPSRREISDAFPDGPAPWPAVRASGADAASSESRRASS